MRRLYSLVAALLVAALTRSFVAADAAAAGAADQKFGDIVRVAPDAEPHSVAILLSDVHGWSAAEARLAQALAADDALVIGIDTPRYEASFDRSGGDCALPGVDLEELSHDVQKEAGMVEYRLPVLVGCHP